VQSSVRYSCITQGLHRQNDNLLLQRDVTTGWNN
jgi:hypothetical protein